MGRPPEVFVRPATTGIDERDICRVKVTNRDRSSRPICGHLRNASSPVREPLSGQPAPAARARRSPAQEPTQAYPPDFIGTTATPSRRIRSPAQCVRDPERRTRPGLGRADRETEWGGGADGIGAQRYRGDGDRGRAGRA